jgi:uncharacterized membrane protein YbhN (UPF0104 family)
MTEAIAELKARRGAVLAACAAMLAIVVLAASPRLLGPEVRKAIAGVGAADPKLLWLACLCFVASIAAGAGSWRAAIGLCGGRLDLGDACARYGAGCLVNSFAPARLGDVLRVALFSRTLDHPDRLWSTGGAFAAVSAAHACVLCVLVVVGAAFGALPLWPVLVLGGAVAAAVGVAWLSRGRRARSHVAHVLDAFRGLGRDPLGGLRVVAWFAAATAARLGAAAAIAAALGVHSPLAAAVIIVPALDLASVIPLTPGNLGVASGAIAMALGSRGVGMTQALAAGLALHAVETATGILFGTGSVLALTQRDADGERRWAVAAAGLAGCVALVGAFSVTVLTDLV